MTRTYQATGIILKGMPFGEADRLLTILTAEYGIIRAIAPGARKHKSSLRGRSELFVINQFLIVKGRNLDKITQAETRHSYPGLSRDLGKLSAGQYLAELALCLALSEQPQTELYELLNEHLRRIEKLTEPEKLYSHLAQALFHLLALAGIAPQVHQCCLTRQPLEGNFQDPQWRVGFSFDAGGLCDLDEFQKNNQSQTPTGKIDGKGANRDNPPPVNAKVNKKLSALELALLQHLGNQFLPELYDILPKDRINLSLEAAWVRVERLLREYAQYHLGRSFRSAVMVDTLAVLEF